MFPALFDGSRIKDLDLTRYIEKRELNLLSTWDLKPTNPSMPSLFIVIQPNLQTPRENTGPDTGLETACSHAPLLTSLRMSCTSLAIF